MNAVAVITIASAALGLLLALLAWLISRAPGWEDQRPLVFVALFAGLAVALHSQATVFADPFWSPWLARLQATCIALDLAAWHYFALRLLRRRPTPVDRAAFAVALAGAGLALVPGALYPGAMAVHDVPSLGVRYTDVLPSRAGEVLFGGLIASTLVLVLRFWQGFRAGVPHAGLPLLGLGLLLVLGAHDALVTSSRASGPYLLDFGFLVPIAAVSVSLLRRFTADAAALSALRSRLESQVEVRSRELTSTQEALARAEKLGALGQLAAGIAHELNNPTSAVAANLEYIEDHLQQTATPPDVRDAVRESRDSVQRIARTVRELSDAGRAALATPEERLPVSLAAVADLAVRAAQGRHGSRVRIADLVPSALFVLGQERALVHVVEHLVVNGIQAVPQGKRDGQVVLRGEREGGRVRLLVEDNGAGMSEETLRRVFEPFFSTRAFGAGAGLGLAVSRGLVASIGGELRLESRPGHGTRAVVELDGAEAPPPRAPGEITGALPLVAGGPGDRRRLLVVDDEPTVLTSLRRLLDQRYEVLLAFSIEEAERLLAREPFDLVLCDLLMPDGGGARLYAGLLRRDPGLAGRVVFLTGGAVSAESRRFLEEQPQPVLEKPLDVEALAEVEVRLLGAAAPVPA